MVEIVKSATVDRWLRKLKDRRAAARVLVRIDRLAAGNPGDSGGDKSSQDRDIEEAHRIAGEWKAER